MLAAMRQLVNGRLAATTVPMQSHGREALPRVCRTPNCRTMELPSHLLLRALALLLLRQPQLQQPQPIPRQPRAKSLLVAVDAGQTLVERSLHSSNEKSRQLQVDLRRLRRCAHNRGGIPGPVMGSRRPRNAQRLRPPMGHCHHLATASCI